MELLAELVQLADGAEAASTSLTEAGGAGFGGIDRQDRQAVEQPSQMATDEAQVALAFNLKPRAADRRGAPLARPPGRRGALRPPEQP